jgi:hypothetical protein
VINSEPYYLMRDGGWDLREAHMHMDLGGYDLSGELLKKVS